MPDGATPFTTRHYSMEDLDAPQKPQNGNGNGNGGDIHSYRIDTDPAETEDWKDSLDAVVEHQGVERAYFLLNTMLKRAQVNKVRLPALVQTPYINTISPEQEPAYPGDEEMERRIRRIIRWNAMAMVVRANAAFPGIGGHLATYASAANLYEVGFNHFFKGKNDNASGDQIFFQGHSSPGIYARAFLEGRIPLEKMERFRREVERGKGLSSYPHPWLMPDFWEFPTVSMGLGPMAAIYQARFNRYLRDRGIKKTDDSRVWAFLGDGECDEPEALGALSLASREGLDNLTFVVNCNLQRLDGPVRGNGKVIQELEAIFHGSGWNVIKVIWGRRWDPLLAQDTDGVLVRRMGEAVDGEFQRYQMEGGAYTREHFFGTDPRLLKMVENLTDDQIARLRRGGHDQKKNHAAFKAAVEHKGQPTVILAHTVKGWTLGGKIESKNVAHNQKKMEEEELRKFRDALQLPIPDAKLAEAPFYHPGADSPEVQYLKARRMALGGYVPSRVVRKKSLTPPPLEKFDYFFKGTKEAVSTTGAFVRILADLCKDPNIGKRIVPTIPDEARTFGMEALFKTLGIYSSVGQLYEPVDSKMLLSYRETKDGQVLEEGITEAGAMSSFTAAATSYATHGEPMIPFYIFYSMFGFQRIGDQAWAVGDARGRGFLMGATSGRTTLNGEGLQHEDGHSLLLASTHPTCKAYDPAFAYEIAIIVQDGLRRMVQENEEGYYYITLQNENYEQPAMPEGVKQGVLDGLYLFRKSTATKGPKVQLFGSGSILMGVLKAQEMLAELGVSADVWSATSYLHLRREALETERWNMLHPESAPRVPLVQRILKGADGPIIASSDYMKAVPDQVVRWVPQLHTLGTDGFGRSDTRAALRRHFEVDAESVVVAALWQLAKRGQMKPADVTKAIKKYGFDPEKPDPRTL
jgi:pyruvate dehydrogenase E1 component